MLYFFDLEIIYDLYYNQIIGILERKKMETFKVISKIKYNDQSFYVLINKSLELYFLKELEDGKVLYPTIDEFKALTEIFRKKQVLTFLKHGKDYKIDPKVISKKGRLIAIGMALALIGGGVYLADDAIIKNQEIQEQIEEYQGELDELEKERIDLIKAKTGTKVEFLNGYEREDIYKVDSTIIPDSNEKLTFCSDFKEFSKEAGVPENPSYEDIIEVLNQNNGVDEKYKDWILEGIGNLEKKLPNANLSVLYYNLKRLTLQETTLEKLKEESDISLVGEYNQETGKASFVKQKDDDSTKFIIYHEVLGHGLSEATFEKNISEEDAYGDGKIVHLNKEKIIVSDSMYVMKINEVTDNSKGGYQFFYIGAGFEEGKADQIAKFAMGDDRIAGSPYVEQSEELRIMREAVDLSLEDYLSKGGANILNQKMQENGVQNSLQYIYSGDIYVSAMKDDRVKSLDEKDGFKGTIIAFFKDYADDKMSQGENRKEIVNKFAKILAEGGDFIHSTFTGEEINYDEFSKEIEDDSKSIKDLENSEKNEIDANELKTENKNSEKNVEERGE